MLEIGKVYHFRLFLGYHYLGDFRGVYGDRFIRPIDENGSHLMTEQFTFDLATGDNVTVMFDGTPIVYAKIASKLYKL